jgi:putative membrane protein
VKRPRSTLIVRLAIALTVPVAALVTPPAWSQAQGGQSSYPYGPGMMWGGGWYGVLFGPLFMILLLVGVVVLVGFMSRWFGSSWHAPPSPRTPLDILKERYARGEIDKEEFEERRRVLRE